MPAPISAPARRERAKLAIRARKLGIDHVETQAASRDYRTQRLADFISELVDQAPPLTQEQRSRLAVLLQGRSDTKMPAASASAGTTDLDELEGHCHAPSAR